MSAKFQSTPMRLELDYHTKAFARNANYKAFLKMNFTDETSINIITEILIYNLMPIGNQLNNSEHLRIHSESEGAVVSSKRLEAAEKNEEIIKRNYRTVSKNLFSGVKKILDCIGLE
ncbi:hypothetical protein VNO77_19282 [Canavalia gladiata]|uniref:Uncharacterized protein n=1 Tax=Canavalia gladiata TaxID=3824 RepID=A0AAN9QPG4_CANGL